MFANSADKEIFGSLKKLFELRLHSCKTMAQAAEIKSNDDDKDTSDNNIDKEFWEDLYKKTEITLDELLSIIRNIDKTMDLTIGKFHDPKQAPNNNGGGGGGGGLLSFFMGGGGQGMDYKKNEMTRDQLCSYSILDDKKISIPLKRDWIIKSSKNSMIIDKCIGCIVGMGIGDAFGHPLEFVAVTRIKEKKKNRPRFSYKDGKFYNEYNRFNLQRGQWTDDASMGLCMADSLIINNKYNGSDIRIRFWNWWQNGYNNAFRKDKNRSSSVGLGGNISSSIYSCKNGKIPTPRFQVNHDREDSGNGSLMRLAPIPIYFYKDIQIARKYSFESSFTTHPGYIAGEACSFMAYIIVSAIQHTQKIKNAKKFIDNVTNKYKEILEKENVIILSKMEKIKQDKNDTNDEQKNNDNNNNNNKEYKLLKREYDAKVLILRLIKSEESDSSLEECWNWKKDYGKLPIIDTFYRRCGGKNVDRFKRKKYNGYPVNADYWGSYCMDGLAMGLHCTYHSKCFGDAIEKCINLLGDADSTGSIGGQIAGAIYGFQSIINDKQQKFLFDQLLDWDDYDFAFKGLLLYKLGSTFKE